MKIAALSTIALVLALSVAHAQSPGTVGAMNDTSRGIATSASDVAMQQSGRGTASDGESVLTGRSTTQANGQSPGTVGATPGDTAQMTSSDH